MSIRAYRTDDLDVVHAINQVEVPAVGSVTPDELAHIAAESSIAMVAEVDGDVAGFCLVLAPGADYGSSNYAWFAERYDDFVYLDRVAIAPAYQRRGIGRALYDEVERVAPDGCRSVRHFLLEVNVRPRNDQSLAFHAGLGFVEVGRRDTDYGVTVAMLAKLLPAT
jgi:hypothetical protein